MKEFIKLENAHISQQNKGALKGNWMIEANTSNEKLWEFSSVISDTDVFHILDFARKYETEAWNEGIKFGKEKARIILEPKLRMAEARINFMKSENDRLATALHNVYEKLEEE